MSTSTACIRCNAPLEADARYCQVCGLSVSGEQTAPLPTLLQVLRQATLGEYEVIREIGQGGMATVYLAHEIALDRKVAIKVMSPQFVHGADMIERFKREARTAAGLNHPHIIPIYSVRESQQLIFFVMKYVSGRPLDAILRDVGALPFPMVRSILADVGSALDFAHRQGVVHRDVKPGNIMIDEEGFAVITDFGIARAIEGESLTRSGTTVGTPSYLSPEACSGEIVGPSADQYSLGIVGYEMVTGALPFSADSSLGMMYAQVHTAPRPTEQLRPDCPPDLRIALTRMLEKSPSDRFPTMREASQALYGGRISGGHAPDDDNIRSHIGILAAPRPSRPVSDQRKTPSSPTSLPRVSPPPISLRTRQRRIRFTRILGGLLLAGMGGILTFVAVEARNRSAAPVDSTPPAPQPTATDLRADSLLLLARGAAEYARQRAVASGIDSGSLRKGDSLVKAADSMIATGDKTGAAMVISRATTLWAVAELPRNLPESNRTSPNTPVGATPPRSNDPPPGQGKTETYAQPTLSDSMQAVAFYDELARAIVSRQLGEVRRLLPNLTADDERVWRGWFEDKDITAMQATFTVRYTSRRADEENTIYVRVFQSIRAKKANGKNERKREVLEYAKLTLGPQGWRQISAEKLRT
jgi:serine/threonine protein kinase